jgi:hypothetical protein
MISTGIDRRRLLCSLKQRVSVSGQESVDGVMEVGAAWVAPVAELRAEARNLSEIADVCDILSARSQGLEAVSHNVAFESTVGRQDGTCLMTAKAARAAEAGRRRGKP